MTTFERIGFDANVQYRVEEQLATGRHRGKQDASPADWLVRAWQSLLPGGRTHLATAVYQALWHDSPDFAWKHRARWTCACQ